MPVIDRNSPTPFYLQVYSQIARGIEDGVYPAGKKLPSIRECARQLGVSNTTIEMAYRRLASEGYVQAKRGSGYVICPLASVPARPDDRFSDEYRQALARLREADSSRDSAGTGAGVPGAAGTTIEFDFAYDQIDQALFPFATWARISREVFFGEDAPKACLYNDRQGLRSLREQIARYVNGEYGLSCDPSQVLVMPTTSGLVGAIASLLDRQPARIALGNPGYDEVGTALEARGCTVETIDVFPYPAWPQIESSLNGADLVFATPASQFPTNHQMPPDVRGQLVKWAERTGAYVIDDEYGWEFQSGMERLPPLASFDRTGRVVTIGTFSNAFTPAICLSYAILPPELMLRWRDRQGKGHPQVPWQTQASMAAFMEEGHWRTHVRKLRIALQRKRDALLQAIEEHLQGAAEVLASSSSLFVLVGMRDGRTERELIDAAAQAGVRVYPTSCYWHRDVPASWNFVLVGFSGIPLERIEPGISALAGAWTV